jgi:hypothetical protein
MDFINRQKIWHFATRMTNENCFAVKLCGRIDIFKFWDIYFIILLLLQFIIEIHRHTVPSHLIRRYVTRQQIKHHQQQQQQPNYYD